MSSPINAFVGFLIRTSYGWLVKLFNFINLLGRLKVTSKECCAGGQKGSIIITALI